jgi:ketosteroid isomerase-like protein
MIGSGKETIRLDATRRFTGPIFGSRSQWNMAMSSASDTLKTAQAYIGFVEVKDLNGVAGVLSEKATQMFLDCPEVSTKEGVERITTDKVKPPPPIATFRGKKAVLNYTHGLMGKFSRLKWVDATWTAAGGHVYFAAKGDMIVKGSGKAYRNNYVMRFEFEGGRILRIYEYGDVKAYSALGLSIRPVEMRAFIRAFVHKLLGGS